MLAGLYAGRSCCANGELDPERKAEDNDLQRREGLKSGNGGPLEQDYLESNVLNTKAVLLNGAGGAAIEHSTDWYL